MGPVLVLFVGLEALGVGLVIRGGGLVQPVEQDQGFFVTLLD